MVSTLLHSHPPCIRSNPAREAPNLVIECYICSRKSHLAPLLAVVGAIDLPSHCAGPCILADSQKHPILGDGVLDFDFKLPCSETGLCMELARNIQANYSLCASDMPFDGARTRVLELKSSGRSCTSLVHVSVSLRSNALHSRLNYCVS
jgi:hypothetical protein